MNISRQKMTAVGHWREWRREELKTRKEENRTSRGEKRIRKINEELEFPESNYRRVYDREGKGCAIPIQKKRGLTKKGCSYVTPLVAKRIKGDREARGGRKGKDTSWFKSEKKQ